MLRTVPRVVLSERLTERESGFGLDRLSGRLAELCDSPDRAALTCAFGLILEGQRRGEPVAYVGGAATGFFPPDAAHSGVDLDALVVVRTADPVARARAADELTRSGAFAIVVIDLFPDQDDRERRIPPALISRLLGLAQKHATAIVFLSPDYDPEAPGSPLGSLISLRAVVRRTAIDRSRHRVRVEVIKDKRGAPGWTSEEMCRGAEGLC
jgi:hypothetical protein